MENRNRLHQLRQHAAALRPRLRAPRLGGPRRGLLRAQRAATGELRSLDRLRCEQRNAVRQWKWRPWHSTVRKVAGARLSSQAESQQHAHDTTPLHSPAHRLHHSIRSMRMTQSSHWQTAYRSHPWSRSRADDRIDNAVRVRQLGAAALLSPQSLRSLTALTRTHPSRALTVLMSASRSALPLPSARLATRRCAEKSRTTHLAGLSRRRLPS